MPPKDDKDGKKLTKAQLKKLERQRKDDLRNSDSDISESGSEDDLGEGGKKPLMQMLKEAMREGSKALARRHGYSAYPWHACIHIQHCDIHIIPST